MCSTSASAPAGVQVQDLGLLESAVRRPATSVFGQDAYPTLAPKAAALMESLCNNHALIDGNKRLAWTATDVILRINGVVLDASIDDAEAFVLGVASGQSNLDVVTDWIGKHAPAT